jgi:4-hydroxybenzoate polyprenyltransferase
MTTAAAPERVSRARAFLQTLRPRQWTKNLFVASPLLFSRHLFETGTFGHSVAAVFLFSLVASSVYILNDILDAKKDREHPVKRLRPIASGRLPVQAAVIGIVLLLSATLAGSYLLRPAFFFTVAGYFLLNVVYSLWLKQAVIIDVMTIAASFVLRIVAGVFAIDVPLSEWLLICASLLALFLGFSKRRHELTLLESNATIHRPVLQEYSPYFLDQMISLVTAATLICYILYTVADDTVSKFGSKNLLLTVPFVLYGLFRYMYLVHQKKTGGDPTSELLTDRPLLLSVALWALAVVIIVYVR